MPYVKATNRHTSDDGKKRAPGDVFRVSSAEATRRTADGQVKRVSVQPVQETRQAKPAAKPKPVTHTAPVKAESKPEAEKKEDKA